MTKITQYEFNILVEIMANNWKVFKEHRPIGAYLPLGQLDGDCKGCNEEWPCNTIRDILSNVLL